MFTENAKFHPFSEKYINIWKHCLLAGEKICVQRKENRCKNWVDRWSKQLNVVIVSWDNLKTNFVSWFMNACEQLSDALNTCLVTMIKTLVLGIGSSQDLKEFRMLSKTLFSNVKNQILVHVFMFSILWITYNCFDVSKIQTLPKILQSCWY